MGERLVVLVENDPVLSERLRAVLSAHSFKVELIADGNELITNQGLRPVLIILCIDPKRLGWAICNKVKRTVQYKDVPMIVTSGEATDKDFEDHKKLRTRAEEYLHKPYSIDVLLSKVDRIVGLRAASSDDAVSLDDAVLEELSVDEAVIEEEISTASLTMPPVNRADPMAGRAELRIDDQIDLETESAFAAIAPSSRTPETLSHKTPVRPTNIASPTPAPVAPAPAPQSVIDTPSARVVDRSGIARATNDPTSPFARRELEQTVPVDRRRTPGSDPSQTLVVQRLASTDNSDSLRASQMAATMPLGDGGRAALDKALADKVAVEKTLADALQRAEKAEAQAVYWHDQRDQLASERDQLVSERERLTSDRDRGSHQAETAQVEKRQLLAERDGLVAERNQLLIERNQIAAERDALRSAEPKGPPPELLATQARLLAERDQLTQERDQLASDRVALRDRYDRLAAERDELLAGHDRLAADFASLRTQLTQLQQAQTAQTGERGTVDAAHAEALEREAARAEAARVEASDLRRERDRMRDEIDRLGQMISGFNAERSKLQSELDEAKIAAVARPAGPVASGGLLQSREVITLKEIIHKKDKEILDLRDALDAKDRQILDARDKVREQERQRRELDEKVLNAERESLGHQEKIEALMADKDVWHEREKGLKGRLEDAQRKLARVDEDLQTTRKRLETEAARGEAALQEERRRLEAAMAEQRQKAEAALLSEQKNADAALQQLVMERATREAELRAQYEAQIARQQASFEEEKRAIESRHAQAWAQFEAQFQARYEERVRRSEQELAGLQARHDSVLAELRTAHGQALAAAAAGQEQAQAQAAADMAALKEAHRQSMEEHRNQLTSEYEARLAHQAREADARVRLLTEERDGLARERAAFSERASGLEVRLGELLGRSQGLESDLATLREKHESSEAEVARLRTGVRDRDGQISSLQAELQTIQEQVQAAYQRLVSDDEQRNRVRRALTIALGILDEGGEGGAPVGGEQESARTPREG